jgi:hypothetical protein
MFLMPPAPPGLDSQNPTILYVLQEELNVAVTRAFSSQAGEGGGVDAITILGASKWRESRRDSTASNPRRSIKRKRNGSSDNLGNELSGDIGQTHVPAVVIVGKPFMVYP